jgi:hypothetical protein
MLRDAYQAGQARCLEELGLVKEAKNPFPGEEAWKMLRDMKMSAPKKAASATHAGPKMKIDHEGARTLDYGQTFAPKPIKSEAKDLSPKAQEAMAVFNYGRGKS